MFYKYTIFQKLNTSILSKDDNIGNVISITTEKSSNKSSIEGILGPKENEGKEDDDSSSGEGGNTKKIVIKAD